MSTIGRKALQGGALLVFIMVFALSYLSAYSGTSAGYATASYALTIVFFLILIALVLGVLAKAAKAGGPRIQRPLSGQTAFPPPPPPDTILVVCPYCNTSQPFKERCANCGGPLPKPGLY